VPRYDYATVGHVTCDVLADGSRQAGGTAFYSALQAARLGLRTLILTRGDPSEIERLLASYSGEFDLEILPAEHTTTLQITGEGTERRQRLLAWAGPIEAPNGGPVEVDAAILHLAPVARETPGEWRGQADFVGLTPQGLVREWNAQGDVVLGPVAPELTLARRDATVFAEHEREWCGALFPKGPGSEPLAPEAQAARSPGGGLVAVTAGPEPTTLHMPDGETVRVPVPTIESPRDDLGAGDVFAAALFVALHEGRPPASAAAFAHAAAAVRISGPGPGAIGGRAAVEERLRSSAPPAPLP
jgi:sugar/nucleoside kinase (ribokinase family)